MKWIKVTVVGNIGVGKSCLCHTYVKNAFPSECGHDTRTLSDQHNAALQIPETKKIYQFFILDLGLGDWGDAYYLLRPTGYPNTSVFLLCFDVSNRFSFECIWNNWYPEIREQRGPQKENPPIVLVGLKSEYRKTRTYAHFDSTKDRYESMDFVSPKEARDMTRKIGAFAYVEASSACKNNVAEVFITSMRAYEKSKPKKPTLLSKIKTKLHKSKSSPDIKENQQKKETKEKGELKEVLTTQSIITSQKNKSHTAEKINEKLIHVMKIVVNYLPPMWLAKLGEVSYDFLVISSSEAIWIPLAKQEDDLYDFQKNGNPQVFYANMQAPVWYNDFSLPPDPPLSPYIPYASDNFIWPPHPERG